jgi:hypothetical protein
MPLHYTKIGFAKTQIKIRWLEFQFKSAQPALRAFQLNF